MTRLDDYRLALLLARPDVTGSELTRVLDEGGPAFAEFVVDYGLGPLWHELTGRAEFLDSRRAAEALYLLQERALREIDDAINGTGIDYVVIKGAGNRLLLYENPAARACHDLDLLVRPHDRVRAADALAHAGFTANPAAQGISRVLVLSRGMVNIDLHWGLLREGRLRRDITDDMLARRRRVGCLWMPDAEDALFLLLVHPAFAKHLAGWNMGLHRVLDVVLWLRTQALDWSAVRGRLTEAGVQTAAWATLRWVELLTQSPSPVVPHEMLGDLEPGRIRKAWIDGWLEKDMSERTSQAHWARLFGFSPFLHDTPLDSLRALAGRYRAHRRRRDDLAAFHDLLGQ